MIRLPPPIFQVGHLERLPLGTTYPAIVAHVGRLLTKLAGHPELVIDFTGVGRPVFDMFVYSGIYSTGVVITGGMTETRDGRTCSVPKLNLVSRLQALLHEARLKIQRELDEAETLVRELQDFRVEYTAAGHLTFNARSGKHDDLVLALAIATWRAHGGGAGSWESFQTLRRVRTGQRASRAISSGLISGNHAIRQRSRWCGASNRQRPPRTIAAQNQSQPLSLARPSGQRSRGGK